MKKPEPDHHELPVELQRTLAMASLGVIQHHGEDFELPRGETMRVARRARLSDVTLIGWTEMTPRRIDAYRNKRGPTLLYTVVVDLKGERRWTVKCCCSPKRWLTPVMAMLQLALKDQIDAVLRARPDLLDGEDRRPLN